MEWTGDYPASYEPPENILDDDLIDDWERRKRQAARQKKCKKKKRRPPHVLTVPSVANASEAVQSQRRDDAAFMETKIAKSMVKTLHKQSTGSKSQHVLFAMEDAPEWIYVALHERLGFASARARRREAARLTAHCRGRRGPAVCVLRRWLVCLLCTKRRMAQTSARTRYARALFVSGCQRPSGCPAPPRRERDTQHTRCRRIRLASRERVRGRRRAQSSSGSSSSMPTSPSSAASSSAGSAKRALGDGDARAARRAAGAGVASNRSTCFLMRLAGVSSSARSNLSLHSWQRS